MARQPIEAERFLVPERVGRPSGRVYLTELARYLNHPLRQLQIFAREHGLMHEVCAGTGYSHVKYVTEEGAMRLIAVFRTRQGTQTLAGKDFHEVRDKLVREWRRDTARKRAKQRAKLAGGDDGDENA